MTPLMIHDAENVPAILPGRQSQSLFDKVKTTPTHSLYPVTRSLLTLSRRTTIKG